MGIESKPGIEHDFQFSKTYLNSDSNENENKDVVTEWYDLLQGEWDQLLHNETFTPHEAAEVMGLSPIFINENNEINQNLLFELLYAEAEKRAQEEKKKISPFQVKIIEPSERQVLSYESFPAGERLEVDSIEYDGSEELGKDQFRTKYIKQVLSELGVEYKLFSNNSMVIEFPVENLTGTDADFEFYIPALKKAVFINNMVGHATIIVHEVEEAQVRQVAEFVTRSAVQRGEHEHQISRVEWPRHNPNSDMAVSIWKREMSYVLTSLLSENKMEKATEFAPLGWLPIGRRKGGVDGIVKLVDKREDTVERRINTILVEHPEWKPKVYFELGGSSLLHYPPEMVTKVVESFEQEKPAPDGWMVIGQVLTDKENTGICKEVGRSNSWVKPRIEAALLVHPEWKARPHKYGSNNITDFYPPALIDYLKELVTIENKLPPIDPESLCIGDFSPNEEVNSGIAGLLERTRDWVQKKINTILVEHPEWKPKQSMTAGGRIRDFYPKEIFNHLKILADAESYAPTGWIPVSGLDEDVGICELVKKNRKWVMVHIKTILSAHPELAPKEFLGKKIRRTQKYYPIEIIQHLQDKIKEEGN